MAFLKDIVFFGRIETFLVVVFGQNQQTHAQHIVQVIVCTTHCGLSVFPKRSLDTISLNAGYGGSGGPPLLADKTSLVRLYQYCQEHAFIQGTNDGFIIIQVQFF